MKAGKKVGMVSIVAVAVFMGAQTSVALPKIKVPAVAGGGESASGMDITQMKADLESKTAESVKQCSAARVAFVDAQLLLCEALGLKADQATKLAEAKTLAEGNASAGDLKKAQKFARHKSGSTTIQMYLHQGPTDEDIENYNDGIAEHEPDNRT